MATFRSLTADPKPLEAFKLGVSKAHGPKSIDATSKDGSTGLPMHLFEWSRNNQDGIERSNVKSVHELEALDPATVRVM